MSSTVFTSDLLRFDSLRLPKSKVITSLPRNLYIDRKQLTLPFSFRGGRDRLSGALGTLTQTSEIPFVTAAYRHDDVNMIHVTKSANSSMLEKLLGTPAQKDKLNIVHCQFFTTRSNNKERNDISSRCNPQNRISHKKKTYELHGKQKAVKALKYRI